VELEPSAGAALRRRALDRERRAHDLVAAAGHDAGETRAAHELDRDADVARGDALLGLHVRRRLRAELDPPGGEPLDPELALGVARRAADADPRPVVVELRLPQELRDRADRREAVVVG